MKLRILVRIQVPEQKKITHKMGYLFLYGIPGFEQWKGETGRFHLLRKGIGKPEGFPKRSEATASNRSPEATARSLSIGNFFV